MLFVSKVNALHHPWKKLFRFKKILLYNNKDKRNDKTDVAFHGGVHFLWLVLFYL